MFEIRVLRSREEKVLLRKPEMEDEFFFYDQQVLDMRTYVVVIEKDEVVGMVAVVDQSMWVPNALGVGFVETKAEHRQRGISKLLIEGLFELARKDGKAISNTPYSPHGLQWLKPVMHKTAERYPDVLLHER